MTRLETIQAALAAGKSRRSVARDLGVSDRTIRRTLEGATSDAAPDDFIPVGPLRVVPTPTRDERLTQGGAIHPGRAFIPCVGCGHPAWRDAPGIDEWTCGCAVGPRSCHGPKQDAAGQIVWAPYRMRPFGLPPDNAA